MARARENRAPTSSPASQALKSIKTASADGLTRVKEEELWNEILSGNEEAFRQLSSHYDRLVAKIVRKFHGLRYQLDDLRQESQFALLKAYSQIKRSGVERPAAYAREVIYHQVCDWLRKDAATSEHHVRQIAKYRIEERELVGELGRQPTLDEIYQRCNWSPLQRKNFERGMRLKNTETLDDGTETIADRRSEGHDRTILDEIVRRETIDIVAAAIEQLDPRSRRVVVGRFFEKLTRDALSKELDITGAEVRQTELKALARIQKHLNNSES